MAKKKRAKVNICDKVDATSERIKKAGSYTRIGKDGIRRINDWPIDILYAKSLLSPDPKINQEMYNSAYRLNKTWHVSGLSGYSSVCITGVNGGSADKSWMTPKSEIALNARQELRIAINLVGKRTWNFIEDICINQLSVEESGLLRSNYKSRERAIAVAMDRLREGLDILSREWGHVR